jgi:hypothetical protein
MPAIVDRPTRAGSSTVSAAGTRSREMAVVLSGRTLPAGAVVGKVTASGKLVYWTVDAVDGSQNVYGVLFDHADATGGDVKQVVLVRGAEANWAELQWHPDVTTLEKNAARVQLLARKLVARDSIPV